MNDRRRLLQRSRWWLALFTIPLVLAVLSAIPLRAKADFLPQLAGAGSRVGTWRPHVAACLARMHQGVTEATREYPFLFYGTARLAFGYLVIAGMFLRPLRDPMRNLWVIHAGMVACALVIPWALMFGPLRGIPLFWQLIDGSFGVAGLVPLSLAGHYAG